MDWEFWMLEENFKIFLEYYGCLCRTLVDNLLTGEIEHSQTGEIAMASGHTCMRQTTESIKMTIA